MNGRFNFIPTVTTLPPLPSFPSKLWSFCFCFQFDIPGNGTTHPYSPDLGLHLIYLFYRGTTKDIVQEMLHVAGNQFHGKAAFISIDMQVHLPLNSFIWSFDKLNSFNSSENMVGLKKFQSYCKVVLLHCTEMKQYLRMDVT